MSGKSSKQAKRRHEVRVKITPVRIHNGKVTLKVKDNIPEEVEIGCGATHIVRVIVPCIESSLGPGILEVGLTDNETMVVLNHPQIDQDERGGHIVFTPDEARHLGNLLLKKAAECKPCS